MADVKFRLKNHGVALTISEWQEAGDVIPSYELDMAWVHVTGVPHAWRHYLGFWALGSVIGATEEVDMLTFRKLGVIRIKVGIMDREHFPFTTDVVFGKHGYELIYTIEPEDFQPAIPTPSNDTMDHDSAVLIMVATWMEVVLIMQQKRRRRIHRHRRVRMLQFQVQLLCS